MQQDIEAGQASAEAADPPRKKTGTLRVLGTGVITGAADDDPSAMGTYASAGATFGLAFEWIALVLRPMMFSVTDLSARFGRVYGNGLLATVWGRYPLAALPADAWRIRRKRDRDRRQRGWRRRGAEDESRASVAGPVGVNLPEPGAT